MTREQQDAYYAALSEADRMAEATPFVEFMLRALSLALEEAASAETCTDQVTDQVTDQADKLLHALDGKAPLKVNELMSAVGLAHKATFRANYLTPALEAGLIEMTHPDSPRSPSQKYLMTAMGRQRMRKS